MASWEEEVAHSLARDSNRAGVGAESDSFSSRRDFISRCCCLVVLMAVYYGVFVSSASGGSFRCSYYFDPLFVVS